MIKKGAYLDGSKVFLPQGKLSQGGSLSTKGRSVYKSDHRPSRHQFFSEHGSGSQQSATLRAQQQVSHSQASRSLTSKHLIKQNFAVIKTKSSVATEK